MSKQTADKIDKLKTLFQTANTSSKSWVAELQIALNAAKYTQNYDAHGVDKALGPDTRTDVLGFVEDNPSTIADMNQDMKRMLIKSSGRSALVATTKGSNAVKNQLEAEVNDILHGRTDLTQLSKDELKAVQTNWALLGTYTGEIDGLTGPLSRKALAAHANPAITIAKVTVPRTAISLTGGASYLKTTFNTRAQTPYAISLTGDPAQILMGNALGGASYLKTPYEKTLSNTLKLIRTAEHKASNLLDNKCYDLSFGSVDRNFTGMSIDQVIEWQRKRINHCKENNITVSSAAGAYQIMRGTLKNLKTQMGLNGDEIFDENMQDKLAFHLLKEKGFDSYASGGMSAGKFLGKIATVWAGLPEDASGLSCYEGDVCGNGATISHGKALDSLKIPTQLTALNLGQNATR